MRTSLNKIKEIEDFSLGNLKGDQSFFFRIRLLLDPSLRLNVMLQRKAYALVNFYGRKKLKAEIESIHQTLFSDPQKISFKDHIEQLFSKR